MSAQESLKWHDAGKSIAEKALYARVLGWPGPMAVNLFAPLSNLTTTSTDELQTFGEVPQRRIQVGTVSQAEDVLFSAATRRLLGHNLRQDEVFGRDQPSVQAVRCRFVAGDQSGAPTLFRGSRVEISRNVGAFAQSAGASRDVAVIGELCLRLVPEAGGVIVTVAHDPEDGTTGLYFCVRTSAPVDDVVAAEDQLHEALFERVPSARRSLFSIGYEFVR